MKGDIALAGYVLTAEELQAMDPLQRAQLMAFVTRRDDPCERSGPTTDTESGPIDVKP